MGVGGARCKIGNSGNGGRVDVATKPGAADSTDRLGSGADWEVEPDVGGSGASPTVEVLANFGTKSRSFTDHGWDACLRVPVTWGGRLLA